jgi:predicted RNase H-like HicB family nuclease
MLTLISLFPHQGDKMKYLIVIETTETGYSAYSPDLEGCVATGSTRDEVEEAMREAIELHLDGLKDEGYPIPTPHSYSTYVEVSA